MKLNTLIKTALSSKLLWKATIKAKELSNNAFRTNKKFSDKKWKQALNFEKTLLQRAGLPKKASLDLAVRNVENKTKKLVKNPFSLNLWRNFLKSKKKLVRTGLKKTALSSELLKNTSKKAFKKSYKLNTLAGKFLRMAQVDRSDVVSKLAKKKSLQGLRLGLESIKRKYN